MSFRFLTAGESHGPALTSLIEGMPSGVPLLAEQINFHLARRQSGYGRGGRMKIETDRAEISAGVRHGFTMGSPIALTVVNSDFESWGDVMKAHPVPEYEKNSVKTRPIEVPRPGHVDYAGLVKYRPENGDMRNILERASARETTMRVAAGSVARRLLEECGIFIGSHVTEIAGVKADLTEILRAKELNERADASEVRCLDEMAAHRMIHEIDAAREAKDTVGGVFEVVADGIPVGLGSHVHWDRKLDGQLAGALMSIHAMKGVEIGLGFEAARRRGSDVHDPFAHFNSTKNDEDGENEEHILPVSRTRNNAGGLEGGVTNGEPLVCRVAMKPISTLMKALPSVNTSTGEATAAHVERSDYCAVPAAGVVGEAMVAIVLADALLEKFGGDSLEEILENVARHRAYTQNIAAKWNR
ncbi:chorismate synthase [Abditibacterium utsteinense]|uniref:Chorismate synthase n=1 Tax=Abditibacterium utsteinense TaxID=1960156 RepID=A0A2S8SSY7_9BACT|nr:chorismate synthase [Abditibacterium utsteinense]PQV63920.1 chorismate synthase [Abditibacterium utsteinense]